MPPAPQHMRANASETFGLVRMSKLISAHVCPWQVILQRVRISAPNYSTFKACFRRLVIYGESSRMCAKSLGVSIVLELKHSHSWIPFRHYVESKPHRFVVSTITFPTTDDRFEAIACGKRLHNNRRPPRRAASVKGRNEAGNRYLGRSPARIMFACSSVSLHP